MNQSKTTKSCNHVTEKGGLEEPLSGILFGIQIITMASITFGNTLTIFAIAKFRYLRTATNMFIASLSMSDLILVLAISLCGLVRHTSVISDCDVRRGTCLACGMLNVTSQCTSLLKPFCHSDRSIYFSILFTAL